MKIARYPFYPFLLLFVLLFIYYLRWTYISPYVRSWDEVDFILALDRFDLLAMQPHFPGYPFFILGGKLFYQWIESASKALSLWNVFISAISSLPIFLLARQTFTIQKSLFVTLFVQSFAYLFIIQTQPMSEATAIACLWWYIWSLHLALKKKSILYSLLPLLFFGLLMGIRLSYIAYGLGILLLWYHEYRQNNLSLKKLSIYLFLAIFFQLFWISGLVLTEGSLRGFIELSFAFTQGHFQDWGGAITATPDPLWERFFTLVFINLFWIGLCGESPTSALLLLILVGIYVYTLIKRRKPLDSFDQWMWILTFAYFLWALFAQNIEKPRHISPLVGMIGFLLIKQLLKNIQSIKSVNLWKKSLLLNTICLFLFTQISQGIDWLDKQVTEKPAIYQMAQTLSTEGDNVILYTWEETRVLQYIQAPFSHRKIFTYDYFIEEIQSFPDRKIYVTNKVLEGFDRQGIDYMDRVKLIHKFHSSAIFDPVYGDILIYQWIPEKIMDNLENSS